MAAIAHSGKTPVVALWVLDDGTDLRFYFSENTLAEAIQGGYAQSTRPEYRKRPASLQYFSAQGIADCSVFIDLATPDRQANPNEHTVAYDKWVNGDRAEWQALLDTAVKRRKADKILLAATLAAYRDAVLQGTALPSVVPAWAS